MKKIDVKGGELTYGQRIEIGHILANVGNIPEWRLCKDVILTLHPNTTYKASVKNIEYFEDILEGIKHWADEEDSKLKPSYTQEEIQAGIEQLGAKLGALPTPTTLGERFGKDPDEILEWKYVKVFGILYLDKQTHEYNKRLHEVYRQKSK